jgi:hypothetical protein
MLLQVAAQDIGQLTDIDCARAAALPVRLPPASPSRDQGGMREPFRGFITCQPADRYWTFQGIETGIFAALAAVLLAVTAVLPVRRDA